MELNKIEQLEFISLDHQQVQQEQSTLQDSNLQLHYMHYPANYECLNNASTNMVTTSADSSSSQGNIPCNHTDHHQSDNSWRIPVSIYGQEVTRSLSIPDHSRTASPNNESEYDILGTTASIPREAAEMMQNDPLAIDTESTTCETSSVPELMLECHVCGKIYKRKFEFLKHIKGKHTDGDYSSLEISSGSYVCSKCDEVIIHKTKHVHKPDDEHSTERSGVHYRCPLCPKIFTSESSWLLHLQGGIHDKVDYSCLVCLESFSSPGQLIEHISVHRAERKHTCPKCPEKFIYAISLERHLTSHVSKSSKTGKYITDSVESVSVHSDNADECAIDYKSGPFPCDICGLKYSYKQNLRKHQRKIHGTRHSFSEPRSCSKCTRTFVKAWYLTQHEKLCDIMQKDKVKSKETITVADDADAKCTICNQVFANRTRMLSHKRDSHRPKLVCDICGHTFTRRTSLRKHIKHSHEGRRDFICGSCGKQFTTASSLQRHERLHSEARPFKCQTCDRAYSTDYLLIVHSELHIDEEDKSFQCERCASRFSRLLTLKHHSKRNCDRRIKSITGSDSGPSKGRVGQTHSRENCVNNRPTLPCSMCKRRFKSETVLARHIRFMHNDDSSLTCQICGLIFRTLPCFRKHQALHNGLLYRCAYCHRTFMNKNTMIIHERRQHTGEKPYTCTICGEAFFTERRLIAHQLVHAGKEIKCEYCQALFASNHEKEKHMRKHTGEKPHVCYVCTKGFSTKRLLESHMRTHTGEKPFSCNICSSRYAEARGLKKHMLSNHPESAPPVLDDNGTGGLLHLAVQYTPATQYNNTQTEDLPQTNYDNQMPPSSQTETMLYFQKL